LNQLEVEAAKQQLAKAVGLLKAKSGSVQESSDGSLTVGTEAITALSRDFVGSDGSQGTSRSGIAGQVQDYADEFKKALSQMTPEQYAAAKEKNLSLAEGYISKAYNQINLSQLLFSAQEGSELQKMKNVLAQAPTQGASSRELHRKVDQLWREFGAAPCKFPAHKAWYCSQ
jgi:hypothetical protein